MKKGLGYGSSRRDREQSGKRKGSPRRSERKEQQEPEHRRKRVVLRRARENRSSVSPCSSTEVTRKSRKKQGSTSDADEEEQDEDEEEDDEYSTSYSSDESVALKPEQKPKKAAAAKAEVKHFAWKKGQLMKSYEVLDLLGDGTFGRVLLAEDSKKREVAIKVIRDVEKYTRNAMREADILKDIKKADESNKGCAKGCVRLHETFFYEQADSRLFCLVCEVLGMSLYDLLKMNRYRGLWVQDIQKFAEQCLQALRFLHEDLQLTHTDLKLENVLFASTEEPEASNFPREAFWQAQQKSPSRRMSQYVRPRCVNIKLIDFGNATYELEHHSTVINTRQYRAPEVILTLGWNERSDLWSVGCILMELYTGSLLFRTHESLEHLVLMEKTLEGFPQPMLERAGQNPHGRFVKQESVADEWRLRWPDGAASTSSEHKVKQQQTLHKLVEKDHRSLAEFAASLLIVDPSRRPSAQTALVHPFFSERFSD